jgi:hypothetical protein
MLLARRDITVAAILSAMVLFIQLASIRGYCSHRQVAERAFHAHALARV